MKAILWISGKTCRVIVRDCENRVIDMNDDWNNRASAEMALLDAYPEAKQKFVRDIERCEELDIEWDRCKNGN